MNAVWIRNRKGSQRWSWTGRDGEAAAAGGAAIRILLTLSHDLHARNWLASGLVDRLLARGHRITLVVPAALSAVVKQAAPSAELTALEPHLGGPIRTRIRALFRTASYVQRSAAHSTYAYKIATRRVTVRARAEVASLRALGRVTDLERAVVAMETRLPLNVQSVALLHLRPDVLVTPTFIHDDCEVELAKAARSCGVPVLAVPSSWDTLTSKGCFLVAPDMVAVWGQDSRRHAVEHHGLPPARVVVTGPPHFDMYASDYYRQEARGDFLLRHGLSPALRVILFAGTTVTYWPDEFDQLRALSRLMERGTALSQRLLWYRPHPRRSVSDIAEVAALPCVYVDPLTRGGGYSVRPDDLLFCRSLLDACDGVVTAFSTMIIEAALLGKPSVVVAFGLGDPGFGSVVQHAEYEHMRDVVSTPGVTMARGLDDLVEGIRGMLTGDVSSDRERLQTRAGEIAHCRDGGACERMVALIEREGRGC